MEHSPSGGAGTDTGTAVGSDGPLSIGAVLHTLREEFPDLTVSRIRFLEAEGLVEPRRTPSGPRRFTAHDVERLGYVLRVQRDHYLPLKTIKAHLDAIARGERPTLPAPGPPPDEEDPGARPAPGPTRIGRQELLAAAGAVERELAEWESYGLLGPGPDGAYDIGAVTVARLVADLGGFGLGPRHLRAMKAAAEREADMVAQVVAPLRCHQNPRARAEAETTVRELAGLCGQLHATLAQIALRSRTS